MDHFIMNNYQKQKPFSSFLSGIAGKMGIPMWAFYVNRGQLIASFGVRDKNGAIMEFFPANAAYHYVSKIGFRTFIKVDGQVYEFFKEENEHQQLIVSGEEVSIIEDQKELNIELKVTYFTLPNEPIAALCRKVTIKNKGDQHRDIAVIDGLMQILPSGIDYGGYKAISNLLQSWMETKFADHYVFYKLRASTDDSAEVSEVVDGNFFFTQANQKPFYLTDYKLIFDEDTSLSTPYQLQKNSINELKRIPQALVNQVPAAMAVLTYNDLVEDTFVSLFGYTKDEALISKIQTKLNVDQLLSKEEENQVIHHALTNAIDTKTSLPMLDAYFKQCYLDNVLRGGTPLMFETKDGDIGYHIYSRKHGDLERDYNFFSLEPAFYSQGNGNFRDVLQNRRSDLLFNPKLKDFNIYQFASLIQADGYNPLSIEGVQFRFEGDIKSYPDYLHGLLEKPFTPGVLATQLYQHQEDIDVKLSEIIKQSKVIIKAAFGEGYWEDHFTYHYDLIDTYLSIYPDRLDHLMFDSKYPFFVSPVTVLPRAQKHVLTKQGKVRQFGSILHHHDQKDSWLSNQHGIIEVNLIGKLITLIANKFAHLDPAGIGLSFEGNKPGWNDAMNGVPGLFGSGVSETIELERLVKLTKHVIKSFPQKEVSLLKSTYQFQTALAHMQSKTEFEKWDERMTLLETYRQSLSEAQEKVSYPALFFEKLIDMIDQTLMRALEKAKEIDEIYPTYLTYEATSYEELKDKDGKPVIGNYGLPTVKVTSFQMKPLPIFLEAPARYLKGLSGKEEGLSIYRHVKKTELFDKKLNVYQTSVSLDDYGHEIGRIRAFTKGWLERESNFLHMTYKYLLGLLKAGLYDEFFAEIQTNFTCFMDPKVYGRSPLENSSFIATSNNPDPKKHGQGFVSRLTGSTAEVLSMWHHIFFGHHLFTFEDNQLVFELKPHIPASWFKDGKVEVLLFNQTQVIYHMDGLYNTYDPHVKISHMTLHQHDDVCEVEGSKVIGKWTKDIREGNVFKINVYIIGGK